MSTTAELLAKCQKWCLIDPSTKGMSSFLRDELIKDAIIQTDRELRHVDSLSPLAWDIQPFSGLQTIGGAEIAGITQADPGVVDADQLDTDIDGHGFDNHATIQDIVVIDGIEGMDELNGRYFLVTYVDADTFSLTSFDGLGDVSTAGYEEWSSGGVIYHAGFVLNTTTILADVSSAWTVKRILPPITFDGYPADLISADLIRNEKYWTDVSNAQMPKRYRYWQNITSPTSLATSHYLMWYPVANQVYNIAFQYQKEIPDITTWTGATVFPYHPVHLHDAIWHGALAKLAGFEGVKVLNANRWFDAYEKDKINFINYSRELLGSQGGSTGMRG